MTTTAQQNNEGAAVHERTSLSDLTKIPEREFERQFRNWMERDEVARSLQSKLRYDLITNFNKTNLGKRLIAETATTTRMTLSPMVLALNTLVAEFLYAQDCHFTLSVFCTEVPFRNTLPDFENVRHFRFSETEILDVMAAICGPSAKNWSLNKEVSKNYGENTSTSLLFFILKAVLEKSAENMQKKISVGTNTRSTIPEQQHDAKSDIYNIHFQYLNKYLIILSKKVKEMTDHFVNLQRRKNYCSISKQPRVRILKSSKHRKYDDLNRSLERVTENLKQVVNAKRKNKHVDTIVKSIETLAAQFQKCAANFENVQKALKSTPRYSAKVEKATSFESLHPTCQPITTRTTAASQTEYEEKSYADWIYEMRYTHNGQKFLDRIEKSLRKTMEKQKKELMAESEIRLRHHSELLKIRYKQKLIEQMYFHGGENAESVEDKQDLKASISEQFRQFEMKHFDLLSKIYESEKENVTAKLKVPPSAAVARQQQGEKNCSNLEVESLDLKMPSSNESFDHEHHIRQVLLPKSSSEIQQHIRQTVDDLMEEEMNVNQIVNDAKLRIRELEQESNQLSEHFLGYLERQRQQKLDARDAAQSVWNDYLKEREKMKEKYLFTKINTDFENSKEIENIRNQILNCTAIDSTIEKEASKFHEKSKSNSSSSNSSPNFRYTNPISKAKDDFFERERKFKEETERILCQVSNSNLSDEILNDELLSKTSKNVLPLQLPLHEPSKRSRPLFSNNIMSHILSEPLYETRTDLYTLWTSSPISITTTTTTSAMATRSLDFKFSTQMTPTIATIATTKVTDVHGINSEFPLTTQRPQNHSVNKSQRREAFSTTIAASVASESLSKQVKIPTTISASMATTLNNNNNNNNVERHEFGGQETANVHCDHNIKSYFGQTEARLNERNNNNNNNNNRGNSSNNDNKGLPENTENSSKSNVKNNTSTERKAVLQQSMARIQQLFNPHQLQRDQKQQHQIMLDDVTEEDEESSTVTQTETEQQSNKKKLIEEKEEKCNNFTTNDVATGIGTSCENVFSHYKNNLQLQQTTTTKTTTITKEHQAPSIEYIGDTSALGDGNAITLTANIRKQQNTTRKTSSNDGNKALEVMPDWQQIGYGTTSGKNAFKEKGKTVKSKRHESIEVDVVIEEKTNENSNVVEPGEVIEKNKSNRGVVDLNAFKVPEESKQLEIGELIESDASAKGKHFTAISSESSSELHISVGGGGGDGTNLVKKGSRKHNLALDAGSDTDSDFWA